MPFEQRLDGGKGIRPVEDSRQREESNAKGPLVQGMQGTVGRRM